VDALWQLDDSDDLILSCSGLHFVRLGQNGVLWHTRRLSWDGFVEVRLTRESIEGMACYPQREEPKAFRVDLQTGRSSGGSYSEEDSEGWERLRE
jgi:hypothetical protein